MIRSVLRMAALLGVSMSLAGCDHSLSRRETISYQAGDAVAWNKAVHTIDPWPAASADTTIPVSGRRVIRVIERYESGASDSADPAPGLMPQIVPVAAQ